MGQCPHQTANGKPLVWNEYKVFLDLQRLGAHQEAREHAPARHGRSRREAPEEAEGGDGRRPDRTHAARRGRHRPPRQRGHQGGLLRGGQRHRHRSVRDDGAHRRAGGEGPHRPHPARARELRRRLRQSRGRGAAQGPVERRGGHDPRGQPRGPRPAARRDRARLRGPRRREQQDQQAAALDRGLRRRRAHRPHLGREPRRSEGPPASRPAARSRSTPFRPRSTCPTAR